MKGVSGRRRYQFRLLERRLGTSKYAAFVTLSVALAWPLRTYLLRQHIATAIAPGPYPIIFAAFPLLLREVPACATFKLGSQACVTMRWDGCLTERARLQTICRLSWSRCELRSVRAAWWRLQVLHLAIGVRSEAVVVWSGAGGPPRSDVGWRLIRLCLRCRWRCRSRRRRPRLLCCVCSQPQLLLRGWSADGAGVGAGALG